MITEIGLKKLQQDLHDLETELKRTVEERAKAAAEGDLRENSAYLFYSERAEVLRSQIAQVLADLKSVKVQDPPAHIDFVEFGHRVKILYESDKRELIITLVGKNDARLKPDWISIESPIGQALLGKRKNDKIKVNDQDVIVIDIAIGDIK